MISLEFAWNLGEGKKFCWIKFIVIYNYDFWGIIYVFVVFDFICNFLLFNIGLVGIDLGT